MPVTQEDRRSSPEAAVPTSFGRGRSALLALADGTIWRGAACGAEGERCGELVFNTSMTGYQEILTDPSYYGQIIVMTQPHIGNYGTTPADDESRRAWASGMVVRSISPVASNSRSAASLESYLHDSATCAISAVDTRALVRHVREFGAINAALSTHVQDEAALIELARGAPAMTGLDLVGSVTCREPYECPPESSTASVQPPLHVVAYDFGIKRQSVRLLQGHGCRVTVVPATTSAEEALRLNPNGIFLSNGPGDPAAVGYAIANVRSLLGRVPIFGICLGHQLLALALGGSTYKLKFGHRGGNHPVRALASGSVEISSHNHGFAVSPANLPACAEVTHISLFDGCVEGLRAPAHRAFSVQYHPESCPGPHDSLAHFDEFVRTMVASRR